MSGFILKSVAQFVTEEHVNACGQDSDSVLVTEIHAGAMVLKIRVAYTATRCHGGIQAWAATEASLPLTMFWGKIDPDGMGIGKLVSAFNHGEGSWLQ